MTEYIKRENAEIVEDLRVTERICRDRMDGTVMLEAADAIERLETDLKDCRNELCLKCGQYQTKHLGSCNGCRWE